MHIGVPHLKRDLSIASSVTLLPVIHGKIRIMFDLRWQISRIYTHHAKSESLLYRLERGTIKSSNTAPVPFTKFDLQVRQQPAALALYRNSSLQFCSMTHGMRGLRSPYVHVTECGKAQILMWLTDMALFLLSRLI